MTHNNWIISLAIMKVLYFVCINLGMMRVAFSSSTRNRLYPNRCQDTVSLVHLLRFIAGDHSPRNVIFPDISVIILWKGGAESASGVKCARGVICGRDFPLAFREFHHFMTFSVFHDLPYHYFLYFQVSGRPASALIFTKVRLQKHTDFSYVFFYVNYLWWRLSVLQSNAFTWQSPCPNCKQKKEHISIST